MTMSSNEWVMFIANIKQHKIVENSIMHTMSRIYCDLELNCISKYVWLVKFYDLLYEYFYTVNGKCFLKNVNYKSWQYF